MVLKPNPWLMAVALAKLMAVAVAAHQVSQTSFVEAHRAGDRLGWAVCFYEPPNGQSCHLDRRRSTMGTPANQNPFKLPQVSNICSLHFFLHAFNPVLNPFSFGFLSLFKLALFCLLSGLRGDSGLSLATLSSSFFLFIFYWFPFLALFHEW